MSARARCLRPEQLLALRWGLAGEDGERPGASARHLAVCMTCRAAADDVRRALERGRDRAAWTGAQAVWPALRERLAAPEPRALPVHLRCTWCHDALVTGEAVHCAACLAPHHEDCFAAQRGCAAPGCGEARLLRPERVAISRRDWRPAVIAAALLLAAGAAWIATPRPPAPSPPAPPRATDPEPRVSVAPAPRRWEELRHDVAALLLHPADPLPDPARAAALARGLQRPVSLRCWRRPLAQVVTTLCTNAGVGLWIDPRLDRMTAVTVCFQRLPLAEALRQVLAPLGLTWRAAALGVRIEPATAAPVVERWERPPVRPWHPGLLAPEALLAGARAAAAEVSGEAAWEAPAELRLEGTQLWVKQTPRAQAAIAAWLAGRSATSAGPDGPWFGVAPGRPTDPALREGLLLRERLRARGPSLKLEAATLWDALALLRGCGLPVWFERGTSGLAAGARPVWLIAPDSTPWELLDLLVAERGLVWDLERDGVWIRAQSRPSREERLQAAVMAALDEDPAGRALRARLHASRLDRVVRGPLIVALEDLIGGAGVPLVVDPALQLDQLGYLDLPADDRPLDEVLDDVLARGGLGWVSHGGGVRVLAPVPPLSAEQRDRVAGARLAPLAPGGQTVVDLGQLWERLERSLLPGVRVWATPALRAARVRCALPGGLRVHEALELARRQAGIRAEWVRFEGEVVLALALEPSGPPLRSWAARLAAPAPETCLPGALRELVAARSALGEAVDAVDPDEPDLAGWRAALAACEGAAARLDEVEDGLRWLAGTIEDGATRARLSELLAVSCSPWTWPFVGAREAELERLERLLDSRPAAAPTALVELLARDEPWARAFPVGVPAAREAARGQARRHGLDGLSQLGTCGIEWASTPAAEGPTIVNVRLGSRAERAWLEAADVVVAAGGRPCPDLLALFDALASCTEERIALRVRRAGRTLDVQLRLRSR